MEIRKPRSQSTGTLQRKKPVSKIAQNRAKKKKTRGVFVVLLLFFLLICAVAVSRIEKLYISNVSVVGVRADYKTQLEEQIKKQLEGETLFVFPKKNIFLFPEDKLTRNLLGNNTYLESIIFKRRGFNSLDVEAVERAPLFYVESSAVTGLFIDTFGVIYSDANTQIGTSTILLRETASHYGASSTGALPVDLESQKGKALSEVYFKNLKRAVDLFKTKNFTIYSVTLRPYGDADLQITPEGGSIRINLYDDIDKTVATFSAARKIETLRTKLSSQRSSLQYIDLRFGNKVFYMFTPAP